MSRIEPLGDQLLVLPSVQEQKVDGIFLPDTNREQTVFGTVVAVGAECKYTREKDTIGFGCWAGIEVQLDDKLFKLLTEGEALFRVNP